MGPTVKRFRASSKKSEIGRTVEGMDEEFGIYCAVLEGPMEKRSERLLNTSLDDIPLETRRKEAGKPLYIARYE